MTLDPEVLKLVIQLVKEYHELYGSWPTPAQIVAELQGA